MGSYGRIRSRFKLASRYDNSLESLLGDPKSKAKSVVLTAEGQRAAE